MKALQAFVETPEGADLLAGYKRAANILKKEDWEHDREPVRATAAGPNYAGRLPLRRNRLHARNEETALDDALDAAEPKVAAALEEEDFEGAMAALASLRGAGGRVFRQGDRQ